MRHTPLRHESSLEPERRPLDQEPRRCGKRAREQMERLFDAKVFLQTWVRVREGWSDDEAALRSLGYHD